MTTLKKICTLSCIFFLQTIDACGAERKEIPKNLAEHGLSHHVLITFFHESLKRPTKEGCCARLQAFFYNTLIYKTPNETRVLIHPGNSYSRLHGIPVLIRPDNSYSRLRKNAPSIFRTVSEDGEPSYCLIPHLHQQWSSRYGEIPLANEAATLSAVTQLVYASLRDNREPIIYVKSDRE